MIEFLKSIINAISNPQISFPLVVILFLLGIRYIEKVATTRFVSISFAAVIGVFLLSLGNENFRVIITKADNVPIIALIFLVGFFVWFGLNKGMNNDRRVAEGLPVLEKTQDKKVLVWPDLVYIELICLLICSIVLILWSIFLKAPLEEPANPSLTPNPSKAPWYFLGLQEMLVYYDPWIAGVVLPGLIIVGLIMIPYLDFNKKGNGYYTFKERKFAISIFLFGFVILWCFLIIVGTFLRGPNWNFFGPYEFWDVHKLEALTNINLSEILWVKWFGTGLPKNWLVREFFGLLAVAGYLTILPVVLSRTFFQEFYKKMGWFRYNFLMFLLLVMASLPIKMFLRWTLNLKYVVAIPEFFFNI